jgi:hypothetical protein
LFKKWLKEWTRNGVQVIEKIRKASRQELESLIGQKAAEGLLSHLGN